MKKIFTMISALLLAAGMSTTVFAADIHMTVDGAPVAWTDAKPFINEDDRTLVPLRPIANALGLEVTWNDDTNTAAFTDGETTIEFTIGSNQYHVFLNDFDMHVYMEMDTTAAIANSRTYAPARYLAECFLYDVSWDQATQTVILVKGEVPAEETISLPEVPDGKYAATSPATTEAGTSVLTYIAFDGVTLVEEPDIFEYSIDAETTLNGLACAYSFADGYVEMDLSPDIAQAPGTYPVTFTIPKGFFSDAKEDIIVFTTLTVTAPKTETVLERILNELEWGVETVYGANEKDVKEAVNESIGWMFAETPFQLTLSDGDFSYDSEGNVIRELWDCTVTVTNTETDESVSVSDILIPLYFDPESAF